MTWVFILQDNNASNFMMVNKTILLCLILAAFIHAGGSQKGCNFPGYMQGNYYSEQTEGDVFTVVQKNIWKESKIDNECWEMTAITTNDTSVESVLVNKKHRKIVTRSTRDQDGRQTPTCFKCYWVFWRTPNILQVRVSESCQQSYESVQKLCGGFPTSSVLITMYNITTNPVNCKDTFEGVYQFSVEIQDGGGICNHGGNKIEACQLPGTEYIENSVVDFTYMRCPHVSTSKSQSLRYQCLGTWEGSEGYKYSAIARTVEKIHKERFRCLLTRTDQRPKDNRFRWVKSRFTQCNKLINTYDGFEKLIVKPVPPPTQYMIPKCNLPRNISGTWFTMGVYETKVVINETHIYFKRKLHEFAFLETYYSCQQTYGTRYMMTSVTIGQCEVDYVCFDLMPRHHSIIRYRMGKPFRMSKNQFGIQQEKMEFRSTCNWLAFTPDRTDTRWKYQVLILDPPTPVPCPVAGRYYFKQTPPNTIRPIIRGGQTEAPRMQVDCLNTVSAMSSCSRDTSQLELDVNYCETVDYKGRPIGEYDEPDIIMNCVGYWMEDMKSYLITHDELDEESGFRCWVYKRLSWTEVAMSRSARAKCSDSQEATSYNNGADLYLELTEQERLFDMCPQRFSDGYNAYKKPFDVFVIGSAPTVFLSFVTFSSSIVLLCFLPKCDWIWFPRPFNTRGFTLRLSDFTFSLRSHGMHCISQGNWISHHFLIFFFGFCIFFLVANFLRTVY